MVIYVDNSIQSGGDWELPARPVRHRQDTHQNKTAVNKGVWEFRTGNQLRREPAASVQADAASYIPGARGVLTPQIVIAIP